MTIMTIELPDHVKEAFDRAFAGEDKNAVVTAILQKAIADKQDAVRISGDEPDLVERFRQFREESSIAPNTGSFDEIREVREQLRRKAGY